MLRFLVPVLLLAIWSVLSLAVVILGALFAVVASRATNDLTLGLAGAVLGGITVAFYSLARAASEIIGALERLKK
jgi:hypothetical protein